MKLWAAFIDALLLLTRLPVARLRPAGERDGGDAVWAYPLVGLLVGAVAGGADWLARRGGLPPTVAAVVTLAVAVLMTGALHEDGLADTADGLGGGRDRVAKLAIMRDSRIGTFGAVALVLTFFARAAAIAALAHPTVALAAAATVGRSAMIPLLLFLTPARPDGLGARVRARRMRSVCGLLLGGVTVCLLLPGRAAAVLLASMLCTAALGRAAHRQIGGYTGDVLGAAAVLGETVALCVAAAS